MAATALIGGADGQLREVRIAESGYYDNQDGTITVVAPPAGTGALKASYWYDVLGRLERQIDWTIDPDNPNNDPNVALQQAAYDRKVNYNTRSQVSSEIVYQYQGSIAQRNVTTNNYGSGTGYALGAVVSSTTAVERTNTPYSSSSVTNYYNWRNGAVLASTTLTGTTNGTTTYVRNGAGVLEQAIIADGRQRTVTFHNDVNGQVIRRNEQDLTAGGDPQEIRHRFNGREMGYVGNNGTLDTDYQTSIDGRELTQGSGAFRNGAASGSAYADFDQFYDPITSHSQGAAGGSYTAQGGETLTQLAAQIWGDASLWYKLAEANPGAGDTLAAGQTLRIPSGVQRSSHTAATFAPYDPAEAMGDTSPTTPTPQKPKKGNKCGVFGAIIMAVVAVAVTVVTAGAALSAAGLVSGGVFGATGGVAAILGGGLMSAAGFGGAVAIGAGAAAVGSVVSQGVGIAIGAQDKFNWGGVALSALAGGVSAGLGTSFGSDWAAAAARGALSSVISQGIGVATRLQSKFDFAGVAAAGVGAAIGSAIGGTRFAAGFGPTGGHILANTAGGIAASAAQSLVTGRSFGDTLIANLPGIIGNTIGGLFAQMMAGGGAAPRVGNASDTREASRGLPELMVEIANMDLQRPFREATTWANDVLQGTSFEEEIVVTGTRRAVTDAEIAAYETQATAEATVAAFEQTVANLDSMLAAPLPVAPAKEVGFTMSVGSLMLREAEYYSFRESLGAKAANYDWGPREEAFRENWRQLGRAGALANQEVYEGGVLLAKGLYTAATVFIPVVGAFEAARQGDFTSMSGFLRSVVSTKVPMARALRPGSFKVPTVRSSVPADSVPALSKAEQLALNATNGRAFEEAGIRGILNHVGLGKNTTAVTRNGVTTILDSAGRPAGLVEFKDVANLSSSPQFRAQLAEALATRQPYNLVVSPGNKTISGPLLNQIRAVNRQVGGGVYRYDPVTDILTPWVK